MRIGTILCFVTAAMLAAPSLAMAAGDVAVVDVQNAMRQTNHWKDALKKLEKQKATLEKDLEKDRKKLKGKYDALEAQKGVLQAKTFDEKLKKLEEEKAKLAQKFYLSQQQLANTEKAYAAQLIKRIEAIVRALAQQKDYLVIVDQGDEAQPNVLYAKKGADITKTVIKKYADVFAKQPLQDPKPRGAPPPRK